MVHTKAATRYTESNTVTHTVAAHTLWYHINPFKSLSLNTFLPPPFFPPFFFRYSFEMGPVHFAAIDTDAYGFDEVAYILDDQYTWLEEDLKAVNRSITPWVVRVFIYLPFKRGLFVVSLDCSP